MDTTYLDNEISKLVQEIKNKQEFLAALTKTREYLQSSLIKNSVHKPANKSSIPTFKKWVIAYLTKEDRPKTGNELRIAYNEEQTKNLSQATFSSKLSLLAKEGPIKMIQDAPNAPKYLWVLTDWVDDKHKIKEEYLKKKQIANPEQPPIFSLLLDK